MRASEREPGVFEAFYVKFMVAKAFAILVSVGMCARSGTPCCPSRDSQAIGDAPNVTYQGGTF